MESHQFFVYILYSEVLRRYYVGSTNDVQTRVERHNTSKYGYTKIGRPWQLEYVAVFESRGAAMKREKQIKSWKSSKAIYELITGK